LTNFLTVLGTPTEKIWPGFTKLPVVQQAALKGKKLSLFRLESGQRLFRFKYSNPCPMIKKQNMFSEYPPSNLRTKFPAQMLSDAGLNLLKKFLNYDPKTRISCEAALKAEYFDESPKAIDPSMFPTWPAKSEMSATGSHPKKDASPKPPSGKNFFLV
jgi:cell division cycle 2-like protein